MPTSAAGTRGALTTSAAKTPKPPSEVVGKTVEEIIKEWTHELQERTSKFRKQAEALGEWDRRIITNRNLLIKLESEVAKVVESQHSLERQLELIETHQQEIEKSLESMEDEAERIYRDERPTLVEDEAAATRDMM
jgi:nuclear pore complex protein Nup62